MARLPGICHYRCRTSCRISHLEPEILNDFFLKDGGRRRCAKCLGWLFGWRGAECWRFCRPSRRPSLRKGRRPGCRPSTSRSNGKARSSRRFRPTASAWFTRCRKPTGRRMRSEEHTSELQSLTNLVCRLLLEKKKKKH